MCGVALPPRGGADQSTRPQTSTSASCLRRLRDALLAVKLSIFGGTSAFVARRRTRSNFVAYVKIFFVLDA